MKQIVSKKISLVLAMAFVFVATLSMAFVLLNMGVEKAAADTYYYDDATVYDISELSFGKSKLPITTNYSVSFGEAATNENIAFRYTLKMPSSNNWAVKQCFFAPSVQYANSNGSVKYVLYYRNENKNVVSLKINNVVASITPSTNFALGGTYVCEFGIKNVYSDEEKETFIGRQVYLLSNESTIFSYFEESNAPIVNGNYIGAGTVDGTVSDNGYIGTAYETYEIAATVITENATGDGTIQGGSVLEGHNCTVIVKPDAASKIALFTVDGEDKTDELVYDETSGNYLYTIENVTSDMEVAAKFDQIYFYGECTVYDIADINEDITKRFIDGNYDDTGILRLPKTSDIAIKFLLGVPTGMNWSLKQAILGTEGSSYGAKCSFYIFYRYEGNAKIGIQDHLSDNAKAFSDVKLEQGKEYEVEIGVLNAYSDEDKTEKAGNLIYVNIDGERAFSYFDDDGVYGDYINVPIVDGTFTAESGYISTTYETHEIAATVITENATGNGTIQGGSVLEGHSHTVIVKPDFTSKVTLFTVDGEDKTDELEYDETSGNYLYTIENVTSDIEVAAKFDQKYFYNECTVYDIADINEDITKRFIDGNYDDTELLRLPKTSDIAIKFLLGVPTGMNWNLKQAILGTEGSSYRTKCSFYIFYRYEGNAKIGIQDNLSDNARAFSDVKLEQGKEYEVEIGVLNAYLDQDKTEKAGNLIYVNIDGERALLYFDDDGSYGDYINVPIVDGTFTAESGYIQTTYDIYKVKVVDGEENVLLEKYVIGGNDFNATIEMARGEAVEAVTLGGEDVSDLITDEAAGISILFENVTADSTFILVKKSNVSVSVNVDLKDLEVISAAPASVMMREPLAFSFKLSEGEALKDVKNNGESILEYCSVENGVVLVKIPCVYKEVNVVVTTEMIEFVLTVEGEGHGTVTASTYSPKANSSVIITARLDEGYEEAYMFDFVKVNGKEVRLNPDGTYVISDVKGDVLVEYSVVAIEDEEESESESESEIESEDESETDKEIQSESQSNKKTSSGCGSSVEVQTIIYLTMLMAAAIIILVRKNENKKSKSTDR